MHSVVGSISFGSTKNLAIIHIERVFLYDIKMYPGWGSNSEAMENVL